MAQLCTREVNGYEVIDSSAQTIVELNELVSALVGGGIGDVILG